MESVKQPPRGIISGRVNYKVMNENEVCADIALSLNRADFKRLRAEQKKRSALLIIVDKSGSMSSLLSTIHQSTKKFAKTYYERHTKRTRMQTCFFDTQIQVIEEPNHDSYCKKVDQFNKSGGSTNFSVALKHVLDLVNSANLRQLQVVFLTDGQDLAKDKTRKLTAELKAELEKREVYSKFSVIGIGEHDGELLGNMSCIGTQKGLYEYVQTKIQSQIQDKVKEFYKEAKREAQVQKGLMVTFPNGKQVFVPISDMGDDIVRFEKESILLEGTQIVAMLKKNPKLRVKEMDTSVDFVEVGDVRSIEAFHFNKVAEEVRKLNFSDITTKLAKEVLKVIQLAKKYKDLATNEFVKADYQLIIDKLQKIEDIVKGSKATQLKDHDRALVEQLRNEILRRVESNEVEMRIAKSSDVGKSASYIHGRLVRSKWPRLNLRALGTAIDTMLRIVEDFKAHHKEYQIKAREKDEDFNDSKGGSGKLKTIELRIKKMFDYKPPEKKDFGDKQPQSIQHKRGFQEETKYSDDGHTPTKQFDDYKNHRGGGHRGGYGDRRGGDDHHRGRKGSVDPYQKNHGGGFRKDRSPYANPHKQRRESQGPISKIDKPYKKDFADTPYQPSSSAQQVKSDLDPSRLPVYNKNKFDILLGKSMQVDELSQKISRELQMNKSGVCVCIIKSKADEELFDRAMKAVSGRPSFSDKKMAFPDRDDPSKLRVVTHRTIRK